MEAPLSGQRIRAARQAQGLTQAALAAAAEISPSYLNLIEHNKRRLSGALLRRLAGALDLPPADLAERPAVALIEALREIAEEEALTSPPQELIARFPDWAAALARLKDKKRDLERLLGALSDRLAHDPALAASLHLLLSHITAIRSTAALLTQRDDIPPLQASRFLRNIHEESRRLSGAAEGLTRQLEGTPGSGPEGGTPQEVLERFLASHDGVFDALEGVEDAPGVIAALLDGAPDMTRPAARAHAEAHLAQLARDARALPLLPFAEEARRQAWAPDVLARRFGAPLAAVMRRLATLRRPGIPAPRFGLLQINAAGLPTFRKEIDGFPLPRYPGACALWPIYTALTQVGRPLRQVLRLEGGAEVIALAIAEPAEALAFDRPPVITASMFMIERLEAGQQAIAFRPEGLAPLAVGTSCRLCQAQDCPARTEPPLLPGPR